MKSRWLIKIIRRLFDKRFFFARLSYIKPIRKIMQVLFFKDDLIYYLPKDSVIKRSSSKTLEINEKIDRQENVIIPSQIVDYFIEEANYHFIMNFCICRVSSNCQNYPKELGCLFLGEAVKNIDPSLGKMVSKKEAHNHVQKCREVGLVHLIGRNKLDTQWLHTGPSEKLLTICNCCECCCLWKMIPSLDLQISDNIQKIPSVSINVNSTCNGCGFCTQNICFVDAISLKENKAIINKDLCRGCGRCIEICPQKAITLTIKKQDFVTETIQKLSKVINVR
ncbi:MAG: 4Fe-4S binding protein [Asgard group archaeon]|nr:4Fe-4S binding protein [Asgard group archaeon]